MVVLKNESKRRRRVRLFSSAAATERLERRLLLSSAVVNTTADVTDAPGSKIVSLRDAIAIANKSTTPTSISFSPTVFATPKTITLNTMDPGLVLSGQQPVTLTGPSAGLTVSGTSSVVFTVEAGATATLSGLTITEAANDGDGGGFKTTAR